MLAAMLAEQENARDARRDARRCQAMPGDARQDAYSTKKTNISASKLKNQRCCLIVFWAALLSNQLICMVFDGASLKGTVQVVRLGGLGERFRER